MIFRRGGPLHGCLLVILITFAAAAALAQNGRIEQGQITSDALTNNLFGDPATRAYRVYLPPSYDTSAKRYPTIYVLHGFTQNERGLVFPVQFNLSSMIISRRVKELIAVFVNGANQLGGSFYLSSPVIGDYETYITRDLVSHIDSKFRTMADRESRGITGFSMGGWGAMHLALKFPGVFSVVVPVAGFYDSRSPWADDAAQQLVRTPPTNVVEVAGLAWPVSGFQALFAGLLPNDQRPPLFADYPFATVNGQLLPVAEAEQRCHMGDVENGDLPRYFQQNVRLRGIRIVHGTSDPFVPVSEARQFTNALTASGIDFEYREFTGGHDYPADLAIPFLSERLQGGEPYIIPPRIGFVRTPTNSLQLTFPAQAGVVYTVESTQDLGNLDWKPATSVIGNERTAMVDVPLEGAARLFRLRARNVP